MKLTKMHGLGNDFILTCDARDDFAEEAKRLCERRLSVGADGLIVVQTSAVADVRMRIFNADGSEAEMCGNGIRCFARFVYDQGIVPKQTMQVETLAGVMKPEIILRDGEVAGVRVDMGKPDFTPGAIPVAADDPMQFAVQAGGRAFSVSSVRMGVPHTVVFCEDVDAAEIDRIGPEIENSAVFPKRTNVNFVQIEGKDRLRMETWERGAGRTLACGTGATAVGIIAHRKGLCGTDVRVRVRAGEMRIELMPDGRAFMTGPAAYVFCGETM